MCGPFDGAACARCEWQNTQSYPPIHLNPDPQPPSLLSAWQALAVLAPFVHEGVLPEVNARMYEAMQVVTLPQVRWHMEMVNAFLCMRYPAVGIPLLIERVSTVDVRPQVRLRVRVGGCGCVCVCVCLGEQGENRWEDE